METVTDLHALVGSFVNFKYILPSGQSIQFWEDDRIYLGNQLPKKNSNRCYGLTADENYLLVCEYGENGWMKKVGSWKMEFAECQRCIRVPAGIILYLTKEVGDGTKGCRVLLFLQNFRFHISLTKRKPFKNIRTVEYRHQMKEMRFYL